MLRLEREMKELKLDLEYLARTYGLNFLESAVCIKEKGGRWVLVLKGSSK
jgi:hypothetical protein